MTTREQGEKQFRDTYKLLTAANGRPPNIIISDKIQGYDTLPVVSVGESNLLAKRAYARGKQDQALIDVERLKLDDLILAIHFCLIRVGEAVGLVGTGEKLRVYLKTKQAHSLLVAWLHSIKNLLEAQRKAGIVFVSENSTDYAAFTTLVDKYASLIDDIDEGRDDGRGLLDFISQVGLPNTKRLIASLRQEIDLGGPTEDPGLAALYKVAYDLYLKYRTDKQKWRIIRDKVLEKLKKPQEQLNNDELIVQEFWQGKEAEERRENLRYVFKPLEKGQLYDGINAE